MWTGYYDKDHGLRFVITSKPTRDCYFAYEVVDGELRKLGKSSSPYELEAKFKIMDIISGTI